MGGLVVITGTGTEVGKTHVGESLLLALRAQGQVVAGLKPIESGFAAGMSDAERLARASSFHVEHEGFRFNAPLSPHLAASREGRDISFDAVSKKAAEVRAVCDWLVLELPGGLFTPLSYSRFNADLVRQLSPRHLLLVGPDRLGVLHDVVCACKASSVEGLAISAVVLNEPPRSDASTGTNCTELQIFFPERLVVETRRGTIEELARSVPILTLASWVTT